MTKLQELFQSYCDPSDMYFGTPKKVGEMVVASDRKVLVWSKLEYIDFEVSEQLGIDIENHISYPPNCMQWIETERQELESLMTVDEKTKVSDDVTCGNCKGRGMDGDSLTYKDKHYCYSFECPVCNGTGVEEAAKFINTGKKIFQNELIKIKESYILAKHFYSLYRILDLLIDAQIDLLGISQGNILFQIGFLRAVIVRYNYSEFDAEKVIYKID